jgi:hypothetical protein
MYIKKNHQKLMKTFSVHTDSDAVFHEKSESVIGFKIGAVTDELSLYFHQLLPQFFCIKMRACRKKA